MVQPGQVSALQFTSLAVSISGHAPTGVATLLPSDWQRQGVPWPVAAHLDMKTASAVPALMPGQRVVARTQHGPLEFLVEGEAFTLSDGTLTLQTGPQANGLSVAAGVPPAALLLAFTEVQRAAGLLPLHAAVLHRNGQTVAVSGPSGSGKSTAALRLGQRGWALVAEDWAWLNPANMQLVGWDSGLRLRPESLQRFAPEFLNTATDEHGKHLLNPARRSGVQTLTAIYFLGAGATRSGSVQSAAQQVRATWEMVGLPLTPAARLATQAGVNRLVHNVPAEMIDRDVLIERLG